MEGRRYVLRSFKCEIISSQMAGAKIIYIVLDTSDRKEKLHQLLNDMWYYYMHVIKGFVNWMNLV